MEPEARYIQQRHFGAVVDQHHQPALLAVPNIKVETDLSVYRCQASQYQSNESQSSHSGVDCSQTSLGCNSPYVKNGPLLPNTSSDYHGARKIGNSALTSFSSVQAVGSTTQQNSAGESGHNFLLDRVSLTPQYHGSALGNGDQPSYTQVKISKTDVASPWSILSQQNDRRQSSISQINKQHCNETSPRSIKRSVDSLQNGKKDHESRQAFDLTCRNRGSASEEGSSIDNSHIASKEETLMTQTLSLQSRCKPKPQTCKVCGKVLSSPSSYYVHMKLHSGNKPYACTICEASFCRKPYLEVHMRTHTGDRPFECDMCYKRFTQKSSLNTHKRVHTGERPYSCDICHKTFAVKSYVTAHRWSHVSEKPFGCQHCGLTFTSKNLFALHIRTHIKQNHECDICGRTFMKDSYLIRHQNRVHRDSNVLYSDANESGSPSMSPPSSSTTSEVNSEGSSVLGQPASNRTEVL